MKALSVTQPWATLVAIGAKKIETRSWATKYRGPLAIHAAKGFSLTARDLVNQEPFFTALRPRTAYQLPCGAIIAVCELKAIYPIGSLAVHYIDLDNGGRACDIPPPEPEHSFGDYTSGRFAWILANARMLPEPIPAKGALGLWEVSGIDLHLLEG